MKEQIELLKKQLRTGSLVVCERRTGKTTALLELIHEEGSDGAIVVCPNSLHASMVASMWKKLFPKEREIQFQIHGDGGPEQKVYVDEWYYCRWRGEFDRAITSFPVPVVVFRKLHKLG